MATKTSANPKNKIPDWLAKVEGDETRAIIRAAADYAQKGYAPFVAKAKEDELRSLTFPSTENKPKQESVFLGYVFVLPLS